MGLSNARDKMIKGEELFSQTLTQCGYIYLSFRLSRRNAIALPMLHQARKDLCQPRLICDIYLDCRQ